MSSRKGKEREEAQSLVDRLHGLEICDGPPPPAKIPKTSDVCSQSGADHETLPVSEPPKDNLDGNSRTRWSSPRKRPAPTPPISPKSNQPVVWERGQLSLSDAVRDSKIMAEQVRGTRRSLKQAVSKYFRFQFADVKVLLRSLDKLANSLDELHPQLDIIASTMLDDIELLDMHLGTLLQESDRVIRAITRGNSRTGPLRGRSRSMRKCMIKDDLGPQMLELAENLEILKRRVESMTLAIVVQRESVSVGNS